MRPTVALLRWDERRRSVCPTTAPHCHHDDRPTVPTVPTVPHITWRHLERGEVFELVRDRDAVARGHHHLLQRHPTIARDGCDRHRATDTVRHGARRAENTRATCVNGDVRHRATRARRACAACATRSARATSQWHGAFTGGHTAAVAAVVMRAQHTVSVSASHPSHRLSLPSASHPLRSHVHIHSHIESHRLGIKTQLEQRVGLFLYDLI